MAQAATLASKSIAWISHLENGRVDITDDHFQALLPIYGQTPKSFQSYLTGAAFVNSPIRAECLDLFNSMSDDVVEAIHPILTKLVSKKEFRS
ncbi:MAG: helix-turn-helix domain-containing protein [Bdellovibrionales bacterium]|nr:helix-turn-helix domain-containing protein [Bdellovibrionales bacterium]